MVHPRTKSLACFCHIFFNDLTSFLPFFSCRYKSEDLDLEKLLTGRKGRSVDSRITKSRVTEGAIVLCIYLACRLLEHLFLSWRHTHLAMFSFVAGCTRASSQGMTGSHGSSLAKMLGADTPLSLARSWSVLRQVRIRQREKWVFCEICADSPSVFEREVTFEEIIASVF